MVPQKVLWTPYNALYKAFWGTTKKCENKNLNIFSLFIRDLDVKD